MLVLIAGTVLVLVALVARLVYVLYDIHQGKPLVLPQHKTVKTLVVLGSGGHTVEMLKMVAALDPVKYSPRMYVVADTDEISHKKLLEVEKDFKVCLLCIVLVHIYFLCFTVYFCHILKYSLYIFVIQF
ncbi:UDP-N-acetylglucosamine transferase subunit ALG14 [Portunus trituberculatus]|uniref:UDP-N-acetylglucosamine transferase subunit ALG14 n=1 Tax=Portunus trituberculatus TaxID=210409 RepID=A0A5B7J4H9_PORTR|nr:UDP-N-acetylglucosamine transferase subunit ALG14 [Portunus trituberculatus]